VTWVDRGVYPDSVPESNPDGWIGKGSGSRECFMDSHPVDEPVVVKAKIWHRKNSNNRTSP